MNNKKIKTMECKICGKQKNSLRQHISLSHKEYTWESYCEEFKHDPKKGRLMTEAQKILLSENKKKFYAETDRGKELKQLQSKTWKKNNPACKPENRAKLSKYAIARLENNNFSASSRGIKVITKDFTTRSMTEYKVILMLKLNCIDFEFEPHSIEYFDDSIKKNYLPDFKIGFEYYEIKSDLHNVDYNKYGKVLESNTNMILHIVTPKQMAKKLGINLPSKYELYSNIKTMLDNDECKIVYSTKKYKHSIIDDIAPNGHKNIKINLLGENKNGMEKDRKC
jgi:hypothetical protein